MRSRAHLAEVAMYLSCSGYNVRDKVECLQRVFCPLKMPSKCQEQGQGSGWKDLKRTASLQGGVIDMHFGQVNDIFTERIELPRSH